MLPITINVRIGLALLLWSSLGAWAQGGPPPAAVAVSPITEGVIAPSAEFRGSVYFKEVAELATETEGQVVEVLFEEGQHLDTGAPLVRLDFTLLAADLETARAEAAQTQARLAQERARFGRAQELLAEEVTTEQEFDDIRFTVEALGHQVSAAKARVARIEREIEKKTIRAPFPGTVVDRQVELGEWANSGDTVAVFARDDVYDVIAYIPEGNLSQLTPGMAVPVSVLGRQLEGVVDATIPRGDIETRTFPVKLRIEGQSGLMEGMSAQVRIPVGAEQRALLVPRDALVRELDATRVAIVVDGKAQLVPVEVVGFAEGQAGVAGEGLALGQQVVVKGQERLRPGQAVNISK